MKYLIQVPSSNLTSRYVNLVVEATLNRLGGVWASIEQIKVLEAHEQGSTPSHLQELPLIHKGFFDSHIHSVWMASQKQKLSLRNCRSIEDAFREIKNYAATKQTNAIQAYDWSQESFSLDIKKVVERFESFFQANPNIELAAFRVCGHAAIVSPKLGHKLGLPKKSYFTDAELDPLHEAFFRWTPKEVEGLFLSSQEALITHGVTAISEMSMSDEMYKGLVSCARSGQLKIDVQGVLDHEVSSDLQRAGPVLYNNKAEVGPLDRAAQFQVRHIKRFLDGSLGARTAWLQKPYDDAETFGDSLFETEELCDWAERMLSYGWYLSFHAIGDGALDQIRTLTGRHNGMLSRQMNPEFSPFFKHATKHRIEHAQVMDDQLFSDLSADNLWSFLMQPGHWVDDRKFIISRLGPTRFYGDSYRLGTLSKESEVSIGLGSDAPISSWEPSEIYKAALTHPNPHERVDRLTCLWHYTTGGRLDLGLDPGQLKLGSTVVVTEF